MHCTIMGSLVPTRPGNEARLWVPVAPWGLDAS